MFHLLEYGLVTEVLSGKVLKQTDTSAWKGMTNELARHNAAHPDDKTLWTNSMFGGMPTVSMYDEFHGDWTNPLYKALMTGARPANFLFISLIGGFLLMLAFGVDRFLAIAGAVAITFCSYNLQIIQVGHNTKMQAIAFMPWVLAGLVFTYRSAMSCLSGRKAREGESSAGKTGNWKEWLPKTVLGAVLFALALSFQIKANHPQITYYLAIIIFIYAIVCLVWLCTDKERRRLAGRFFAASALLLVIGGIGIATNLNKLIPTYRYAEYSGNQLIELPYAGGRYSMLVLLPAEDVSPDAVLPYLNEDTYKEALASMEKKEVMLRLPKFKIETTTLLNRALEAMGAKRVFTSSAELGGISDGRIAVDEVKQKCFVEVNNDLLCQWWIKLSSFPMLSKT